MCTIAIERLAKRCSPIFATRASLRFADNTTAPRGPSASSSFTSHGRGMCASGNIAAYHDDSAMLVEQHVRMILET